MYLAYFRDQPIHLTHTNKFKPRLLQLQNTLASDIEQIDRGPHVAEEFKLTFGRWIDVMWESHLRMPITHGHKRCSSDPGITQNEPPKRVDPTAPQLARIPEQAAFDI